MSDDATAILSTKVSFKNPKEVICTMKAAQDLRVLLQKPGIRLMPGVYDCLSAKVCASVGFEVLYTSGLSISGTLLGMPDIGLLCVDENIRHLSNIVNSVSVPIIADCDTGYGGPTNVYRLVKQLVQMGVVNVFYVDNDLNYITQFFFC